MLIFSPRRKYLEHYHLSIWPDDALIEFILNNKKLCSVLLSFKQISMWASLWFVEVFHFEIIIKVNIISTGTCKIKQQVILDILLLWELWCCSDKEILAKKLTPLILLLKFIGRRKWKISLNVVKEAKWGNVSQNVLREWVGVTNARKGKVCYE